MSKTLDSWDLHLASLSENTSKIYRRNLGYFMERWDYTPESLYETRLQHVESTDRRDQLVIPNQVKVQMSEITKSGKSGSTARHIYKAVKAFFESQNLEFSVKAKDKPPKFHNGSQVILKGQIKDLLDYVGNEFKERNRAVILMLKDSGLRVGDLSNMNVSHYREATVRQDENGEKYAEFKEYKTEKTKAPAYIHLGPESVGALNRYLATREKDGEILTGDTPLFVGRQGRMTSGSLSQVVIRLASFIGGEGRKLTAHSLRKFFQTSLEAQGVNQNVIGKYNGRQATGSTGPYSHPEEVPGLLYKTYVENYGALRLKENGDVKELRKKLAHIERAKDEEIERLREDVARLQAGKNSEVTALRREIEDLRDMFKAVIQEPELIENIKKRLG